MRRRRMMIDQTVICLDDTECFCDPQLTLSKDIFISSIEMGRKI